jgi:hypothetical protein
MNNIEVSFFEGGISITKPTKTVSLEWAIDYIREGRGYATIRPVRIEKDDKKKKELKKRCSYFTFSGTFSARNAGSLEKHSGLITLDFDDVGDVEAVALQLMEDRYIMVMFRSTGGEGLKALAKIDPDRHLESFVSLAKYFHHKYGLTLDASGKDVCRACFESIDENIYVNENSSVYLPDIEMEVDMETGEVITQERQYPKFEIKSELEYVYGIADQISEKGIDLTIGYNEWLKIGFSLASLGEAGRPIFHQLSRQSNDYNEKDTELKFDNCLKTTTWRDPAYFLSQAKKAGCDMRKFIRTEAIRTSEGASREQAGSKSDEDEERVSNVLAIRFPVKLTKSEEKECGDFVRKYGFLSWKNITYIGKIRDGEMTFEPKSNFSMTPHYLVTDEEGKTTRIIEFTNSKKERRIDHITTDAFVSVDAFAKYVERGNFWSLFDRREWTKVKSWLYEVTPAAKEINTLGQQEDGFFAFSNGILADGKFHEINNLGIVSLKGKNFFFPALSDIYRNNRMTYQFEREFIHTKRNVAFSSWAELFCKVYGENGRIGLMYCCMAMFSDIVFKTDGFFPMLYLYGKPESGKSTMAYSILSLLHKTEGKSVGSNINSVSMAALFRKLGQVRNGMVLLEEYNNELDTKQVEILKQIWNRDAYLKADSSQSNTSNRTVSHQIESSVVITGQHLPVADVALFTRVILLQFFKNDGFSEESMELISDLKSLQNESLTQIATSILKHRPEMEEHYATNYKFWKKRYAKRFVGTNVSRIGQHCAIVMAIYQTLSSKMNFPFLEEELRISLEKIAEAQNGMMQNSEESSQFWEAMAYLVHSGILEENRQFTFREMNQIAVRRDTAKSETVYNFPQLSEVMFIRLSQIQPVYAKEMRQRGQKYMDSDTLRSYLKNSPAYIGEKKSMKFGESNSSAMVFNYSLLQEDFSLRKIAFMADTSETQLMTPDHLEIENEIVPF